MTNQPWGIHWFRRDLRIADNSALRENWLRTDGRTLGLFCFDSRFLSRPDFSHIRFAFFLKTLRALQTDLKEQGGDLLIVDCLPREAFTRLIALCKKRGLPHPTIVTWGRDYEPFARARDQNIEAVLQNAQIETSHHRDHLVFEPHEVLKDDGECYKVYSPFARKWAELLDGSERIAEPGRAAAYFAKKGRKADLFKLSWSDLFGDAFLSDAYAEFARENNRHVSIAIPEAGFFEAFGHLRKFKSMLKDYKQNRDFPGLKGTSRLSMFLKNGSLTVPQIIRELDLTQASFHGSDGRSQFLKELIWREFYYSILFHRPDVETQSFLPQYRDIQWKNDKAHFQRWKEGTTGFPIVDAGMRELRTTGWMHNRVRMIVASFLTKDLLIDWRWGERYFMEMLLDGDLAPNNGGWQWAASTGCDPQPYFRIFNPWLQSKKFDPEGVYIKKFVPELSRAPTKALHEADFDRLPWKYPTPIVDHAVQRNHALALYQN